MYLASSKWNFSKILSLDPPPPPLEGQKMAFFGRLLTCQTLLPITPNWNKISIQTQRGYFKDNRASK